MPLTLDDFDFDLPPGLIAQHPPAVRGASRLLHVDGGRLADLAFADLPRLLDADDLLVFNDTRVIKARLFGAKASGGRIEALVERVIDARTVVAQIRASHAPQPGSLLSFGDGFDAVVESRDGGFYRLRLESADDAWTLLERHGRLPLPPYIEHAPGAEDEARYQTVYARAPGAVAAPTAGLHFDEAMLERLARAGVGMARLTLHVGAGTFLPVRVADIAEHRMHHEWFEISGETAQAVNEARAAGKRIVAVGTTSLRALEAAADEGGTVHAGARETDIFITPGYRFRVVDRLVTNFHLPKSTLLMLVSAFAGFEEIRAAYAHAIAHRYRFFSYGDAMLLERMKP